MRGRRMSACRRLDRPQPEEAPMSGFRRRPNILKSKPRFVPRLESLEDRSLPSTLTVTNLAEAGPGSLRQSVQAANVTPGPDTIRFAGGLSGTIALKSGELSITDGLTIAGPGADRLTVSGDD